MAYFLKEVNNTISIADTERRGLVVNGRLVRLMGDVIRNANAVDTSASKAPTTVNDDMSAVDEELRAPRYARSLSDWRALEQDWRDGRTTSQELVKRIYGVVGSVGVSSNLVLDAEPASYYLMDTVVDLSPSLIVNLGAGMAVNHQFPSGKAPGIGSMLALAATGSRLTASREQIAGDLDRAYVNDNRLRGALSTQAAALEAAERRYSAAVDMRLTGPADSAAVDQAGLQLLDATMAYQTTASRELDQLLQERLRAQTLMRLAVTLLAALSLLLAFYCFGGFYIGTLDGLRQLFCTAQRIAHGEFDDVSPTVKPDEVGRLASDLECVMRARTEELVEARNAAETANVAKSHFLANMSHELRTPLNAVLGFSNLMRSDPAISGQNRETLDIINRSGEHLLSLINNVLDVARIEAGRVTVDIAPFDLMRLIRDIADMMRMKAEQKELSLVYDQSSQFPRFVRSDAAKVRQILINLVGNAIQYTERGCVTITLKSQPLDATRTTLTFEIADTGIGVAKEDYERMFEPFVQLSTSASRKGTGLGLAITRQYVSLLAGTITVQSTRAGDEGAQPSSIGTRVSVQFPVDLAT